MTQKERLNQLRRSIQYTSLRKKPGKVSYDNDAVVSAGKAIGTAGAISGGVNQMGVMLWSAEKKANNARIKILQDQLAEISKDNSGDVPKDKLTEIKFKIAELKANNNEIDRKISTIKKMRNGSLAASAGGFAVARGKQVLNNYRDVTDIYSVMGRNTGVSKPKP